MVLFYSRQLFKLLCKVKTVTEVSVVTHVWPEVLFSVFLVSQLAHVPLFPCENESMDEVRSDTGVQTCSEYRLKNSGVERNAEI